VKGRGLGCAKLHEFNQSSTNTAELLNHIALPFHGKTAFLCLHALVGHIFDRQPSRDSIRSRVIHVIRATSKRRKLNRAIMHGASTA
jgi:hypothetical protein